jgi:stearoyl-CoA desaturase (Delta-9 desaturase)
MWAILYTLATTHITFACVSLYLHRGLSHRLFTFHPALEHFFRFWLWLTDGVVVKEWAAQHRKHHKYTDVQGDPHSPVLFGINKIAITGFFVTVWHRYRFLDSDWALEHYGKGTPDDWIEHHIYTPYSRCGLLLLAAIDILLFGWATGLIVWAVQIIWVPLWSNSVITGLAHWWGYQHPGSKDNSRNLCPVGIIMVGEELHNNHHVQPMNPNLRHRWYEFDLGWEYIKFLKFLGLAKVNS